MILKSVLVITGCSVLGVVIGLGVGMLLRALAPDFAFFVLTGSDPRYAHINNYAHVNPKQLSIGLGIANGSFIGLIAGCVVVLADAIKNRSEKLGNQAELN